MRFELAPHAANQVLQRVAVPLTLAPDGVDALPGGSKIVLRTPVIAGTQGKRRVAIDVIDEGTGIAADVLSHVFKPFFTTKEAGSGTGLGLTSVQRIAERHGGSVEVKSTPRSGSTFILRLPSAFTAKASPWIQPGEATPEEVARQLAACPSGALQVERIGDAG